MGDCAKEWVKLSEFGSKFSKLVCRCDISDAMSGFFVVEARCVRALAPRLNGSDSKYSLIFWRQAGQRLASVKCLIDFEIESHARASWM